VRTVPLYSEAYCLLIAAESPLGDREQVTWAEVGNIPLCLLTPDMQNRRIIDGLLAAAGHEHLTPTLESNSMIVLFSHIRTRQWATVMPSRLAETLGLDEVIRAIPIVEPSAIHTIGLVVPNRDVTSPVAAALIAEALEVAVTLNR
jgi:DNA-binding transcriptional LysR family regulator